MEEEEEGDEYEEGAEQRRNDCVFLAPPPPPPPPLTASHLLRIAEDVRWGVLQSRCVALFSCKCLCESRVTNARRAIST